MASTVEIANRALQILGAKRIVSLTEDSRNARAIAAAYQPVKKAELRKHVWNFAVARVQLAADATAPAFTRSTSFTLPSDFLRLLPPDPEVNLNDLDWIVEGRCIITNDSAPLDVRYIRNVDDPNTFDSLFCEALSAKLAEQLCEEITQSNTKVATAQAFYKDVVAEAKKANAVEKVAEQPPEDSWVTCRN